MKSKVELSAFSIIITAVVVIALIAGVATSRAKEESFILLFILVGLLLVSLYFYPKSLEATKDSFIIHRGFSDKVIHYKDIIAVDRCYPSIGGLRLCGSGGFFGYWGYFTDIVIGNYFGYYGKRSQALLIRLKNGRQYVVSCAEPDEMLYTLTEKMHASAAHSGK